MRSYIKLNNYSNLFLCNSRLIHISSVLNMPNKEEVANNPEIEPDLDNIPSVDGESLLKGLDEMREYSDTMSPSEYNAEFSTSYAEAFPKLKELQDSKIYDSVKNKNWREIFSNALTNCELDNSLKFKEVLKDIPGDTDLQKTLALSSILKKNNNHANFATKTNDLNNQNDEINKGYNEVFNNQSESANSGKLIDFTTDNKLVIDIDKFSNLSNKFFDALNKHENLTFGVNMSLIGLSNYMMWKGIVKVYDNTQKPVNLASFNSETAKLSALKITQLNRLAFTSVGSLLVLFGIRHMLNMTKVLNVDINVNKTSSSNEINKSIIFFTFFKNLNKWNKLLILILLVPVILFTYYHYF